MKKLVMAGCLMAGLLVAFSSSGNAQVSRTYSAHVPFDFTVGSKTLKAGDYTVGPAAGITNDRAIVLRSNSNGRIVIVGLAVIGSTQNETDGTLTFSQASAGWALQNINTPGFALKLKTTKSAVINVASFNDASKTQTIILKN